MFRLTRFLQDLLDLTEGSFLLLVQVFHGDGVAKLWRRGLQVRKYHSDSKIIWVTMTPIQKKKKKESMHFLQFQMHFKRVLLSPERCGHPGGWTPAGSCVFVSHHSQQILRKW